MEKNDDNSDDLRSNPEPQLYISHELNDWFIGLPAPLLKPKARR
jgi:hypothetical protein